MSSRRIKKQVFDILAQEDLSVVLSTLLEMPAGYVVNSLFSAICRSEEHIRWYAVSAMGQTVARIAEKNMENGRIIMRRILWSLNDESGGIGWGAPESFAEILVQHDGLAEEYVHMLISYMRGDGEEAFQDGNYLEHEILQRGLLWGIGRLALKKPYLLKERSIEDDLIPYLVSTDATVRGMASRALGCICSHKAKRILVRLEDDHEPVRLYDNGVFLTLSVAELADRALQHLQTDMCKGG
jgi:hypothetical protein